MKKCISPRAGRAVSCDQALPGIARFMVIQVGVVLASIPAWFFYRALGSASPMLIDFAHVLTPNAFCLIQWYNFSKFAVVNITENARRARGSSPGSPPQNVCVVSLGQLGGRRKVRSISHIQLPGILRFVVTEAVDTLTSFFCLTFFLSRVGCRIHSSPTLVSFRQTLLLIAHAERSLLTVFFLFSTFAAI